MNVLRQLSSILSWSVYLCIVGHLLIAVPMLTGYQPVVVLSEGMESALPVGNAIYYKGAVFEQIQEGDPITFHTDEDGSLVTHRVVEKQELSRDLIIKGDTNETVDPNPVPYSRVAGRVVDVKIPYAGYFITCDRIPQAIGIMGGTLVIRILLDFICLGKKREEKA